MSAVLLPRPNKPSSTLTSREKINDFPYILYTYTTEESPFGCPIHACQGDDNPLLLIPSVCWPIRLIQSQSTAVYTVSITERVASNREIERVCKLSCITHPG
jgi:hypothetical protein